MTGNLCPHCAAGGRTGTQRNNSCYFNPKRMTDGRDWARKFMERKGVACNDND